MEATLREIVAVPASCKPVGLWDREGCSSDALVFAAELDSPAFSARLQDPGTLEVL